MHTSEGIATKRFDGTPAAVALARRFVGEHLGAWGLYVLCEPVLLALSELVTNAVVHGRGMVEVTLTRRDGSVTVAVGDEGTGTPVLRPREAPEPVVGGWGLQFVDRLADAWGTRRSPDGGTIVWFELAAPAPPA